MPYMTTPALHRLVLVGPPRTSEREAKIRRYRLARLKLDHGLRPRGEQAYAHLKRLYD